MDSQYDLKFDHPLEYWSFQLQVYGILNTLKLSEKENMHIKLLLRDIFTLVDNIWPGSKVKVFGSLVTGLAYKDSDVDCFIEMPPHLQVLPGNSRQIVARYTTFKNTFKIISYAEGVKVPIAKLRHLITGRTCDLSFKGPVAVETSKLIRYLLKLDDRAGDLAMLVKHWARVNQLIDLSNHALTLLVIFFLQHKKILPSVAWLQKNATSNVIDGWNTAFIPLPYLSRNNQPLYNLFIDFFQYYYNFSFKTFVVCPYLGYPVHVSQFSNLNSLPIEYWLYKERVRNGSSRPIILGYLCIQDPFQHNENCAHFFNSFESNELKFSFFSALSTILRLPSNKVLIALFNIDTPTSPDPRKEFNWKFYLFIVTCFVFIYSVLLK